MLFIPISANPATECVFVAAFSYHNRQKIHVSCRMSFNGVCENPHPICLSAFSFVPLSLFLHTAWSCVVARETLTQQESHSLISCHSSKTV